MGENSKIEWTDHTFNPWIGCTKVSAACDHCYAEAENKRRKWAANGEWGPHAERHRTSEAYWRHPLIWDRNAYHSGQRARVFCASLADVFDNQVPNEWRADLWRLIRDTPNLDWLLLTKCPQNIRKMLPAGWLTHGGWPNVWLGVTAEDGGEFERRWLHLALIPCAVRFVSYEPALGDLAWVLKRMGPATIPDWIIAGGESGPHARPAEARWFQDVRDECARLGIAFLFKQMGRYVPDGQTIADGRKVITKHDEAEYASLPKKRAGRLLDGVEHNGFPQ
jgi:protein gp37